MSYKLIKPSCETFGTMLRRLRNASHKTITSVARSLSVSIAYLSDVERGQRAPLTLERINALACVLELTQEQECDLMIAAERAGYCPHCNGYIEV